MLLMGELEQKPKFFFVRKVSNLGGVLNKLMQLKRITDKGLGAKPQLIFVNLKKTAFLTQFRSHFARFWSRLKN